MRCLLSATRCCRAERLSSRAVALPARFSAAVSLLELMRLLRAESRCSREARSDELLELGVLGLVITRLEEAELRLVDGAAGAGRDGRVERAEVLPATIRLLDGRELLELIAPLLDLLKLKPRDLLEELLLDTLLRDGVLGRLVLLRLMLGRDGLDTLGLLLVLGRELRAAREERFAPLDARALARLDPLRRPCDTGADARTRMQAIANIAIRRLFSCFFDDMTASFPDGSIQHPSTRGTPLSGMSFLRPQTRIYRPGSFAEKAAANSNRSKNPFLSPFYRIYLHDTCRCSGSNIKRHQIVRK